MALPGEPDANELQQHRLAQVTCSQAQEQANEAKLARIRTMEETIDSNLSEWREYRRECIERRRQGWRYGRVYVRGEDSETSQGFGSGQGVALSGIGDGAGAPVRRYGAHSGTSASVSSTNTQIAGVDEADLVKTDGRYLYLALNGALHIVLGSEPRLISATRVTGKVRELFVERDRALLYVAHGGNGAAPCRYGYDCRFNGDGSSSELVLFDITDRKRPRILHRLQLSASLVSSRKIGSTVHTVVTQSDVAPRYETWPQGVAACATTEDVATSRFNELKRKNRILIARSSFGELPTVRVDGVQTTVCDTVLQAADGPGVASTSVVSFDLLGNLQDLRVTTIRSRAGAVFASANALYLATDVGPRAAQETFGGAARPDYEERTEVHKFRIGQDPRETAYVGSGLVPGRVLNQFSMDEWSGYLRVATTRGRLPDADVYSLVSVLGETSSGSLVRVGAVTNIAPGEDIRSVRFQGDRGYVVTFKKTDPLFVLDLSVPERPAILGELKIPGFSTYMQHIGADRLLSIGFDTQERGNVAYFDGLLLQLFDVSNETRPKLLFREKIGTRGSSSEAATDHHAFNYVADRQLLAVPATVCSGESRDREPGSLQFSGLLLYRVDPSSGFERLGGVSHTVRRDANCSTWWSQSRSAVKRSVLFGDLVFSITSTELKVQRLDKLGRDLATIRLAP